MLNSVALFLFLWDSAKDFFKKVSWRFRKIITKMCVGNWLQLRNCPTNIYLFKVNNRKTRKWCKIFSKLTITILLTLNIFHTFLLVFLLLTWKKWMLRIEWNEFKVQWRFWVAVVTKIINFRSFDSLSLTIIIIFHPRDKRCNKVKIIDITIIIFISLIGNVL